MKEKLEEAQRSKNQRDKINKVVSDLKNQRNELKQMIFSNSKEITLLKEERDKFIEGADLKLENLRKEYKKILNMLQRLERKVETSVLTKEREKKLVEESNKLRTKLKKLENAMKLEDKIWILRKRNKELKEKEQKLYKEMVEHVAQAEQYHKKMQICYQEINENRDVVKKIKK
ncbi:MAG: hypothetical protein ACE5K4_09815 [Candidatus Hydrothermarchaeota archaeon]